MYSPTSIYPTPSSPQTLVNLSLYGESAPLCGLVLQQYCVDKNPTSDAGCFVHAYNTTTGVIGPTALPLEHHCSGPRCFAQFPNFGSPGTTLNCTSGSIFQDSESLVTVYGVTDLFTSRAQLQRRSAICLRIECSDNSSLYRDVQLAWILLESLITFFFSLELFLRLLSDSLNSSILSAYDVLSVLPLFVEIFRALYLYGSLSRMDLSILPSSPEPFFFNAMRSIKVRTVSTVNCCVLYTADCLLSTEYYYSTDCVCAIIPFTIITCFCTFLFHFIV
jgi:hypothetical protein